MIVVEWVVNNWGDILAQLLSVAGIVIVIVKYSGKKLVASYIETHFAKQLEDHRSQLAVMFDRKQRFYSKEYEVLPELWGHLNDTTLALRTSIEAILPSVDLKNMNEDEFMKFVERTSFSEAQKDQLLQSSFDKRDNEYYYILKMQLIHSAHQSLNQFQNYLNKNRIFLEDSLKEKFGAIEDKIRGSWSCSFVAQSGQNLNHDMLLKALSIVHKDIMPLMTEIELLVHGKLEPNHSHTTTALDSR